MKVSEHLDSAEKWCQGACAVDKNGDIVSNMRGPEACAWCLYGSLCVCYPDIKVRSTRATLMEEALIRLHKTNVGFIYWQDEPGRTFEEVRALILEAGV